jgi:hypothetical protein
VSSVDITTPEIVATGIDRDEAIGRWRAEGGAEVRVAQVALTMPLVIVNAVTLVVICGALVPMICSVASRRGRSAMSCSRSCARRSVLGSCRCRASLSRSPIRVAGHVAQLRGTAHAAAGRAR